MGATRRGCDHQSQDLAGLAGFVALEVATSARYTDIVILGSAVIAVLEVCRLPGGAAAAERSRLVARVGFVFCAGIAIFDALIYGCPLRSGYRPA